MQFSLFTALLFFSFTCYGQQVSTYEVDFISADSFFLIERVTTAPTKEDPRPQTSQTNKLFRSIEGLSEFVEGIKTKAKADKEAAEKQYRQAGEMELIAQKIEDAAKSLNPTPAPKKQE